MTFVRVFPDVKGNVAHGDVINRGEHSRIVPIHPILLQQDLLSWEQLLGISDPQAIQESGPSLPLDFTVSARQVLEIGDPVYVTEQAVAKGKFRRSEIPDPAQYQRLAKSVASRYAFSRLVGMVVPPKMQAVGDEGIYDEAMRGMPLIDGDTETGRYAVLADRRRLGRLLPIDVSALPAEDTRKWDAWLGDDTEDSGLYIHLEYPAKPSASLLQKVTAIVRRNMELELTASGQGLETLDTDELERRVAEAVDEPNLVALVPHLSLRWLKRASRGLPEEPPA